MNDPGEIRKRLLKYFVPVAVISVVLNIPKFFETTASLVATTADGAAGGNLTTASTGWPFPGYEVVLNVTAMRVDPVYSSFVNWSQLFSLGVLPVCLLAYFNAKIYQVNC